MPSEISYLFTGLLLGLSAGLSPGPLMTLVISETLRYGARAGIKVAIAPLLSDFPIVLISIIILSRLNNVNWILGVISLLGALFLIYLAYEGFVFKGVEPEVLQSKSRSLRKDLIVNFLNPSPYMFWLIIGAPLFLKAYQKTIIAASLFIVFFYLSLVGLKILLALIVGRSRFFLKSKSYVCTIRFLSLILLLFALYFIKDGVGYLR